MNTGVNRPAFVLGCAAPSALLLRVQLRINSVDS
jgi:hypothetical protein